MKDNPQGFLDCPVCNIAMNLEQKLRGPSIIYADKIDIKEFSIYKCSKCGLAINNNYKEIKFDAIEYENNTKLIQNFNDQLIEEHITTCINKFLNQNIRLVELGAGSRLGLLTNLQARLNCKAIAIDPTYRNFAKKNLNSNIKYYKSIDEIPIIQTHNILICRNMIEYLTPENLSNIFQIIFKDEGLLFLEIQTINKEKWGSIFSFSEYKTFYTHLTLDKLIKGNNKSIDWISSSDILGEKRKFLSGFIQNIQPKTKVEYFSSLYELCQEITTLKTQNNNILWGSGGRSLMFLYNEGQNFINKVVDPSQKRQGILLPGFNYVEKPEKINPKDNIIILNSRYLEFAIAQVPSNCSFFVLGIDE